MAFAVFSGLALMLVALYLNADTIIEVPEHPHPGFYDHQLPDSQFIAMALSFAALTETFQFSTAATQFSKERPFLWGHALERFDKETTERRLREIESEHLSQVFDVDQGATRVVRRPELDRIEVTLVGGLSGAKDCSSVTMSIEMTTIPRNVTNEYGIVITDYQRKCFVKP